MRNFDEISRTIDTWSGSFEELAKTLTNEEYKILFEEGTLEYTDDEWIEENCFNVGEYKNMLYYFISDWLMSSIAGSYNGSNNDSITDNLFRLWKEYR